MRRTAGGRMETVSRELLVGGERRCWWTRKARLDSGGGLGFSSRLGCLLRTVVHDVRGSGK